ncbi:hypothetical protein D3C75_1039920 [compost metagenome]
MQAVDAQGRHAHTVVEDGADQLGERRRPVTGAADGSGQRGHQVIERIANFLPALVDVEERFDFQDGADTVVTGALVTALEQPAVDFLALELAGLDDVLERGVRVGQQVAHHPQVQRVDLGDEALVGQVIGAGAIGEVQAFEALVGEFLLVGGLFACEVRTHKGVEALLAGLG